MAFDSDRQRIVLFGGYDHLYRAETWDYDGASWTLRSESRPPGQTEGGGLAYDSLRHRMLLFGNQDLWALGTPPTIVIQPTSSASCTGGGVTFSVDATSSSTLHYQWRKNATDLIDMPDRIVGANAPLLTIVGIGANDEGLYDCILTNACGNRTTSQAILRLCDHLADLTCDGAVGLADLSVLMSNFGRLDSPQRTDGDLDADGSVGLADLSIMLSAFGTMCP